MCRRVWTSRETTPRHTNLLGFRRYSDASSVSPRGLMTGRTPYKRDARLTATPNKGPGRTQAPSYLYLALSLYLMCPKVVSRPRPQLWHITVVPTCEDLLGALRAGTCHARTLYAFLIGPAPGRALAHDPCVRGPIQTARSCRVCLLYTSPSPRD